MEPKDIKQMVKMREKGMTFAQIAEDLGYLSTTTVWRKLWGMKRTPQRHPKLIHIKKLRKEGMTYRSIGLRVGLSYERVRKILEDS
jgi:lambda repressor-like predicted transcriptional regulator